MNMWLCKRDLSKECEGKYRDCTDCALDKVRNEIAECGSIWVAYAITGHSDRDIENLIEDVVKQAKEQVLDIIDKYRTESEADK
jgi:hypothetical protein